MALYQELALGNTTVKLRWEEPQASSGLDRKDLAVIPRGVYRGFIPQPGAGAFDLDFVVDSVYADSLAAYETSGPVVALGTFTPTPGWNVTVYTAATQTITVPVGARDGTNKAVVLRAQYNEGNSPVTDAFIQIVDATDTRITDTILALINVPALAPNLADPSVTITRAPTPASLQPLFITVGDGFQSRGDFTGNRVAAGGADTSNSIQAALDSLAAQNALRGTSGTSDGGVIFIKRGEYAPTTTITVPDFVQILGEGHFATNITKPGGVIPLFDLSSNTEVEIAKMSFDGNADASPIIRVNNCFRCAIRECRFSGNTTFAPINVTGPSEDTVVDTITSGGAPASTAVNGGVVQIGAAAIRTKVIGLAVDVRMLAGATDSVLNVGRVEGSGTLVTSFADDSNRIFGPTQPFLTGYIRGMEVLPGTLSLIPAPAGYTVLSVLPGVIEIDGILFSNPIQTIIPGAIAFAGFSPVYVYARRNVATAALEFVRTTIPPEYRQERNTWVLPGTGTGGIPSERYVGSVTTNSAGTKWAGHIKTGEEVYWVNALFTDLSTVTATLTVAAAATTSGIATVSLGALPKLPNKLVSGGPLTAMLAYLDIELEYTPAVAEARNVVLGATSSSTAFGPWIRLAAHFERFSAAVGEATRIRFPNVSIHPVLTAVGVAAPVPSIDLQILDIRPSAALRDYTARIAVKGYLDMR